MRILSAASAVCVVLALNGPGAAHAQAPADLARPLIEQMMRTPAEADRTAILDAYAGQLQASFITAFNERGLDLRRSGRLDEAGRVFLAGKDIAARLGERRRVATLLINYAAVPGQQADYPAALAAANEAKAIAEQLHDDSILAASLNTIGLIDKQVGDFDGALAAYQRSVELARASHNEETESRAMANLGVMYSMQGHYRDALEVGLQSLALRERLGRQEDVALELNNIGMVYESQGNEALALEYYRRSLALEEQLGADTTTALSNIGHVYRVSGRLDEALVSFREVLARFAARGNRAGTARSIYNIASTRELQERYAEALEGYRESLAIREAINDRSGLNETLSSMAATLARLHRYDEALAAAERARVLAIELRSNDLLWEPQTLIGQLHHTLGHAAEAERAYRDAIGTIEQLRSEVAGGAEARERFFEGKVNAYRGLANVLFQQGRLREALDASERVRGRVLAEALSSGDADAPLLTVPERERQRQLQRDVVATTARVRVLERAPRTDPAALAAAADRLRQVRVVSDEFRDALDARYPVRRLARGVVSADLWKSAGEVVSDSRTALLEYVVTEETTYVLVMTRADREDDAALTVQTFSAPIDDKVLAVRAESFRRKLASRALDFHADARALYDVLLAPARRALAGKTRLIIIPDGALWLVPFEALESARDSAVVDEAAVSYAPSIEVLRAMHARRAALPAAGPPRLLVAANPTSDRPPLPDAERQAHDLAALYGASRTRLLVGGAATEPRVRAAAADVTVLHFATHGVLDDANPMYSFLQLTRSGAGDADGDGRLEAWEIQALKFDASVAVLTACDTGRGRLADGEGLIGLAWAFFAAGTPATVVSLWPLESASATTLTLAFHRRLRASLVEGRAEVADSLRAAALELRRDPRYRHPFYWAGLVAVGDGY